MHRIISVSELAKLRAHCQVERGRPAPEDLHVRSGRWQLRYERTSARRSLRPSQATWSSLSFEGMQKRPHFRDPASSSSCSLTRSRGAPGGSPRA